MEEAVVTHHAVYLPYPPPATNRSKKLAYFSYPPATNRSKKLAYFCTSHFSSQHVGFKPFTSHKQPCHELIPGPSEEDIVRWLQVWREWRWPFAPSHVVLCLQHVHLPWSYLNSFLSSSLFKFMHVSLVCEITMSLIC